MIRWRNDAFPNVLYRPRTLFLESYLYVRCTTRVFIDASPTIYPFFGGGGGADVVMG
jgi:hypothetical protein